MFAIKMLLDLVERLIMKKFKDKVSYKSSLLQQGASANWVVTFTSSAVIVIFNVIIVIVSTIVRMKETRRDAACLYTTRGSCLCAQGV